MEKNPDHSCFKAGYVWGITGISLISFIAGFISIQTTLVTGRIHDLIVMNSVISFTYLLLAWIYERSGKSIKDNSGLYFLLSIVFKLLIICFTTLLLIDFKNYENYSLVIVFLVSYLSCFTYDLIYKLKFLNKKQSFSDFKDFN